MPRIVRCALIQASNAVSTERPLEQIRKAMIDKHMKLIPSRPREKRPRSSACRNFSTDPTSVPSRTPAGMN